jgi:hypothetical protein
VEHTTYTIAAREHLPLRLSVAHSAIDHPTLGHLLTHQTPTAYQKDLLHTKAYYKQKNNVRFNTNWGLVVISQQIYSVV